MRRLPLAIAGLLIAASSLADELTAMPPSGVADVPGDFCVTLREANGSVPRGHFQTRLRVCAREGQAEVVRVADYPEIFDDIHRRIAVAPVSAAAMRELYARVGAWEPGRWQEHRIVDGHAAPSHPALPGGGICQLSIRAKDVGRTLDCTRGTVQASSEAEKEATLAAIRALIPAAGWRDVGL